MANDIDLFENLNLADAEVRISFKALKGHIASGYLTIIKASFKHRDWTKILSRELIIMSENSNSAQSLIRCWIVDIILSGNVDGFDVPCR